MARFLLTAGVAVLFISAAWAQSSTESAVTDPLDLSGKLAQENNQSYSSRAPGTWVQTAIGRHNEFIDARVNGPRAGQRPELPQDETTSTSSTGTSSSLTSLLDLANLLSGDLGSLTDLANLGSSSTSTNDALVQYITQLAQANGASAQNKSINRAQTTDQAYGGAIARLPKAEDRLQDTTDTTDTTTERKFTSRLLESWATTFFSALTLGFQSNEFIDILKDALRPLVLPSVDNEDDDDSDANDGDGIEDLPSDGGDGGDSTI